MTTEFDIGRGASSGRIGEAGARVFMLGQREESNTVHVAGPGVDEYTEVKQIVDLTDVDLVVPEFRSTGHYTGTFTPRAGWWDTWDPTELAQFDFDLPVDVALNKVPGGFSFTRQGEMQYGIETYSPDATACRVTPPGSVGAMLLGANTPHVFGVDPVPTTTFEWWMKFDADEHATSNGVSPEILTMWDVNDGICVRLLGAAGIGAHSWALQFRVRVGGVTTNYAILGFAIVANRPWELYQLVFNSAAAPGDQLRLYIDGVLQGSAAAAMVAFARPPAGVPIQYGSPSLYGSIDAMRILDFALDTNPADLLLSYTECTSAPPAVEHEWLAQILIDGVVAVSRVIDKNESERDWWDFSAPVRHLTGPHEVAFRLVWHTV